MDRQGDHETSDRADEQFRKALDVIIESYNGAPADRLYRHAIYCFDSLIEISHNTEDIRDFARRHEIDNKYLVDGANFVISKMHFNAESNYYITLGVPRTATYDEIRERWKRLMLLYHPDKQTGEEEWVSERAKKVNEAYSTLKDEDKRRSYDLKLIEQAMSQHAPLQPKIRTVPSAPGRPRLRTPVDPGWERKKKYIPKILVGLYVLAALAFFGYIYIQNNSELLESALIAKTEQAEPAEQISGPAREKAPGNIMLSDAKKATEPSLIPKPKMDGDPDVSQMNRIPKVRQQKMTDETAGRDETSPKETAPLLTPPAPNSMVKLPLRHQESGAGPSVPSLKDSLPIEERSKKPELPLPANQAKAEPAQTVQDRNSGGLTKEEVEDFMKLYASVYARNDVNTFMSLFSKSAVENNRLYYKEIREAYRETFSEKINSYKINSMTILVSGQTATVSGVYDLNRYMSAEDRWIRYSGRIQWKLIKENDQLKIISMNYDK